MQQQEKKRMSELNDAEGKATTAVPYEIINMKVAPQF